MARSPAGLPTGIRLSDHISLGVIAKTFPPDRVRQILAETGRASERDLPVRVMVYYTIALALYTRYMAAVRRRSRFGRSPSAPPWRPPSRGYCTIEQVSLNRLFGSTRWSIARPRPAPGRVS